METKKTRREIIVNMPYSLLSILIKYKILKKFVDMEIIFPSEEYISAFCKYDFITPKILGEILDKASKKDLDIVYELYEIERLEY